MQGYVGLVGNFDGDAGTFYSNFESEFISKVLPSEFNDRYEHFDTEEEFDKAVFASSEDLDKKHYCAAIVWKTIDIGNSYEYSIRLKQNSLPSTIQFNSRQRGLSDNTLQYLETGYISLQLFVDNFIARQELDSNAKDITLTFIPLSTGK